MEAVRAALLVVFLCLCLPSPNLGAILHPREHQETPLAILIDTLWWGNNRGRGIEKILKLGAESGLSLDIQNEQGWSPLHFSVEYNAPKVTERLLIDGADPNLYENDGWTALHFAGYHGNLEAAKMLLQFKADASILNKDQNMPYNMAVNQNHPAELSELLATHAYSRAVEQNDIYKLSQILQDFPSLFPVNSMVNDKTALLLACEAKAPEVAEKLLGIGALPHYANPRTGHTPLHTAVQLGDLSTVKVLLQASARLRDSEQGGAVDVNTANNEGLSALALAELLVRESATGEVDARLENIPKVDSLYIDVQTRKQILSALQRYAGLPTDEEAQQAKQAADLRAAEEKEKERLRKSKTFLSP